MKTEFQTNFSYTYMYKNQSYKHHTFLPPTHVIQNNILKSSQQQQKNVALSSLDINH